MSSAVATQLSNAAVSALTALNLSYDSTAFTVAARKSPSLPQGKSPPQIVVSVNDLRRYRDITASVRLCTYSLAATVITSGGAILADDPALQLIHEQVRNCIAQASTFASVSVFNQVDAGGEIPFDVSALTRAVLNYGIQPFTIETLEARS